MKTDVFPIIIKEAGVSASIRETVQTKKGRQYIAYVVDYFVLGERKREWRSDLEKAKEAALEACRKISTGEQQVLELKNDDRMAYVRATDALSEMATPIDVACREYVEAMKILGSVGSLTEAARAFVKQHAVVANKPVPEAVNELIDEIEIEQKNTSNGTRRKDAWLKLLNAHLVGKFAEDFNCHVSDLSSVTDYPVSADITLQYDALNRLTNMVDAVGTTRYPYDGVGQLLSEDGPWDNDTVNSTYANRLRTGLSVAMPNASPWVQTYAYDEMDRMTNVTSPAGSFGYYFGWETILYYGPRTGSVLQQLSLPNGAVITNDFDSVGRMTATHLINSSGTALDTEDYVYNLGGQRTRQVFTAGNYVNYSYDNIVLEN
jgi:YD repeat-containing protein